MALKVLSTDISHKSDVGGVALSLDNAAQVHDVAQSMLQRMRQARPDARIAGFTVQAMVRRTHAQELIVGASIDSVFGPVIRDAIQRYCVEETEKLLKPIRAFFKKQGLEAEFIGQPGNVTDVIARKAQSAASLRPCT